MLTGQCWCFNEHETFPRLISPCWLLDVHLWWDHMIQKSNTYLSQNVRTAFERVRNATFPSRLIRHLDQNCILGIYYILYCWYLDRTKRQTSIYDDWNKMHASKQTKQQWNSIYVSVHVCACPNSQWLVLRCLSHFSWALV